MMDNLGIIGGSGLTALDGLEITSEKECTTPYGNPSARLVFGNYAGNEIIFLARHGNPHVIPPHRVNYRANIWALRENGAENLIAVNTVGGITGEMHPERIAIPDQIIDYTWSRDHTYFEEDLDRVIHVDFTHPYSEVLRQKIIDSAAELELDVIEGGTYGATQGPRLESAGEIRRMQKDGCNIVGMTGMPEAALARELSLEYACIALVVNWAAGAGRTEEVISMGMIEKHMKSGMHQIMLLLTGILNCR